MKRGKSNSHVPASTSKRENELPLSAASSSSSSSSHQRYGEGSSKRVAFSFTGSADRRRSRDGADVNNGNSTPGSAVTFGSGGNIAYPYSQKRPTPDSRAFERYTQLQKKTDVSSSSIFSQEPKPPPSIRPTRPCPPTPNPTRERRSGNGGAPLSERARIRTPYTSYKGQRNIASASPARGGRSSKSSSFELHDTRVLFTSPFRPAVGGRDDAPTFDYICQIGEGTFGVVHKAKCREDGIVYAVKRSRVPFRTSRQRDRALDEALMWEKVGDCPYLVPLYRAWQEDCTLCLQLQLCVGGNLKDHVETYRPQQPPESIIWLWLRDAAMALKHVHAHGLVHNDVKPSNMYLAVGEEEQASSSASMTRATRSASGGLNPSMLRTRSPSPFDKEMFGRLMLGDFGQAFKVGELPDGEEGDSTYMAREVLSGVASPSCDMFSLGISFYELAADVILPENGNMWHQLRNGNIPPLPEHRSDELYRLLCNLMHPNDKERFSAEQVLSHPQIRARGNDRIPFTKADVLRGPQLVRQGSFDIGMDLDDSMERSSTPTMSMALFPPPSTFLQSEEELTSFPVPFSARASPPAQAQRVTPTLGLGDESPRRSLFVDFDCAEGSDTSMLQRSTEDLSDVTGTAPRRLQPPNIDDMFDE